MFPLELLPTPKFSKLTNPLKLMVYVFGRDAPKNEYELNFKFQSLVIG